MCRAESYELCASGGLMFIRHTAQRAGKATVHETDRWLSRKAEAIWIFLLAGRAR